MNLKKIITFMAVLVFVFHRKFLHLKQQFQLQVLAMMG